MRSKITSAFLTITLICGLSFLSIAQETSVEQLEKRITELEKKVTMLEQKLANTQQTVMPNAKQVSEKSVWRTLKRGMTESEVRSILGEPEKIRVSGIFTFWSYSKQDSHSKITFINDRLDSWEEPE